MKNNQNDINNRNRETVDTAEWFDYQKEHNNDPRTNEFFVYRFESKNQDLGKEDNNFQLGKEENTDISRAKEVKTEDFSRRTETSEAGTTTSSSTSATSSTATTASNTAVKTVTTTVETAVVATGTVALVVGGGMVIYNQTTEKPQICQFEGLRAEQNRIYYSLLVGNDMVQIESGNPGDDCDIVLELSSYTDDLIDSVAVKNYGRIEGEFEGLNYSTEYTLSVYQKSLLDLHKELLIRKSITTGEEEMDIPPQPDNTKNDLSFDCEIDSDGNPHYYINLSYDTENNYFSDFSVQYYNTNVEPEPISDRIYLSAPYTSRQEIKTPDNFDYQGSYNVYVYCMSTYPGDLVLERFADEITPKEVLLFKRTIDFSAVEPVVNPHIFTLTFSGYRYNYGAIDYYAQFDYSDPNGYYSEFAILLYSGDSLVCTVYLDTPYTDKQLVSLDGINSTGTYQAKIMCESISPYDYHNDGSGQTSSATIEYGQVEVDFSKIEYEEEPLSERNVLFFRHQNIYEDEFLYVKLSYEDEQEFYSGFYLIFKADEFVSEQVMLEVPQEDNEISFDGLDYEGTYDVEVYCLSTNLYDWDENFESSESGSQDGQIILWLTINGVDLSKVDKTVDEPEFEPSATFVRHIGSLLEQTLYVTLSYDDPSQRYDNFFLYIGEDENQYLLDSPSINKQEIRGYDPSNLTGEQIVQVWCQRDSYTNETGPDTIKLFEQVVNFSTISVEEDPLDPSLETHSVVLDIEYDIYSDPHYYATFVYEDENNYYSNFTLVFKDEDQENLGSYTLVNPSKRQEIPSNSVNLYEELQGTVEVWCDSTNPRDLNSQQGTSSSVNIMWCSQEFDLAEAEMSKIENNVSIVFDKYTEEDMTNNLYVTLSYDDPDTRLYAFYMELYQNDQYVGVTEMLSAPYTARQIVTINDMDAYNLTGEYDLKLYATVRGSEITKLIAEKTINFSAISSNSATITNNIFFKKLYRQNGEERYYANITIASDAEYYSYFRIELLDVDTEEEESGATFDDDYLGGSYTQIELDLPEPKDYKVAVYCFSTKQADIDANPEGVEHSGGPDQTSVEIKLFEKTIDFNELPVEQEKYHASELLGWTFEDFKGYYGGSLGRYTTLMFNDPCDFWSDFTIQVNNGDEPEITSFTFEAESGVTQRVGDGQNLFETLDNEYEVIIYVRSFDPLIENQTADGTLVELEKFNFDFSSLEATINSAAPYLVFSKETTPGASGPTYEFTANLHYDYYDKYYGYVLSFTPVTGGNQIQENAYMFTAGSPVTLETFNDGTGTYLVELTAYDDYGNQVTLYSETIDFSTV